MMREGEVENKIEQEIKKWSGKIGKKLENVGPAAPKGNEFLRNINAYVSDSAHFHDKGDLVRSFEAIIWAWAWLEIGMELGLLK